MSYRSIARAAGILAIGLSSCVGVRQETRNRKASPFILPDSLADSMRTFFRVSQANSAADEEAIQRLHERRPDLAELDQPFGKDPRDVARELELADAYLAEGLEAPAFRLYEELRFKGMTDARLELGLAQILNRYRDPSALEHAQRAVELDSEMIAAWELLGRIYLQANRLEEALAAWSTACQLDPDNANLLTNIGYSFVLAGDWASARTYLEGAVRIDSPPVQAQNNLGVVLARLGDDDGALRAFGIVNPPAAAYNNLGVVYLARGQKAAAAKAFSDAIAIDPSYSLARKNLAELSAGRPWVKVVNLLPFGTMNGPLLPAAAVTPSWNLQDDAAGRTKPLFSNAVSERVFPTIVELAAFPSSSFKVGVAQAEPVAVPGSADVVAVDAPFARRTDVLTPSSPWNGLLVVPNFGLTRAAASALTRVTLNRSQVSAPGDSSTIPVIFWWIPLFAAAVGLGGAGRRGMFIGSLCGTVGIVTAMFL